MSENFDEVPEGMVRFAPAIKDGLLVLIEAGEDALVLDRGEASKLLNWVWFRQGNIALPGESRQYDSKSELVLPQAGLTVNIRQGLLNLDVERLGLEAQMDRQQAWALVFPIIGILGMLRRHGEDAPTGPVDVFSPEAEAAKVRYGIGMVPRNIIVG